MLFYRSPAMWRVEFDPDCQLLRIRLTREVDLSEMRLLARAHARALEATGGEPFRVLVDLRGLRPLDTQAAELLRDMKRVAVRLEGYRGRAVVVDSPTVAMQQHNATLEEGGDEREFITMEETQAQSFLSKLG